MPELPEVETVMRGLSAVLAGRRIARAELHREGMRWPFPPNLAGRLTGRRVLGFRRRGKYMLMRLEGGESSAGRTGTPGRHGPALQPAAAARPVGSARQGLDEVLVVVGVHCRHQRLLLGQGLRAARLVGGVAGADGRRRRSSAAPTLAAARLCGYRGARHIALAACVEFIHTATLLHDDVVDESALRRGQASANALFGNKPSVLVGDFLFARAFQLMVADGSLRVLDILSAAAATIAEGEVLQLVTGLNYREARPAV